MATRFYLPRAATSVPISPTPDAEWEDTSALARALMVRDASLVDAIGTVSFTDSDVTNKDILLRQYISEELTPGQVITPAQSVVFQSQASETTSNNNMFTAFGLRIVNTDGTIVRKWMTNSTVRRDNTEIAVTTITNRRNSHIDDGAHYTTQAGDRLVLEIGAGGDPSLTGGVHSFSMRLGGNGHGGDLPQNDTDITSNKNPWVEIDDTLTFVSSGGGGNRRRRMIICGAQA